MGISWFRWRSNHCEGGGREEERERWEKERERREGG